MGNKRRSTLAHKQRHDFDDEDDDEEEVVEDLEKETLNPEQVANIQSRKKLIAKRRVNDSVSESSSFKPFSVFSALNKPVDTSKPQIPATVETEDKPSSVFAGFKGFSGFKPMPPTTTTTTTTTTSSTFSFGATEKPATAAASLSTNSNGSLLSASSSLVSDKSSSFSSSTGSTSSFSPFLSNSNKNQPANTIYSNGSKNENESTASSKKETDMSNNINDTDLVFINELNALYEKCYGKSENVGSFKLSNNLINDAVKTLNGNATKTITTEPEDKYAVLLAELNKHVSKWISKHIEENPYVVLTPVFVDYFKYLILLEKEFFPETLSKSNKKDSDDKPLVNGNGVFKSSANNSVLTNGSSSLFTKTSDKDSSTSSFSFGSNKTSLHINGNKEEPVKGTSTKEKESTAKPSSSPDIIIEGSEETEKNNKILADSSKTFASFMKNSNSNQTFNQINLFGNSNAEKSVASATNLFTVKPSETEAIGSNLTAKSMPEPSNTLSVSSSLFKFGSNNSISSIAGAGIGVSASSSISGISTLSSNTVASIESPLKKAQDLFSSATSPSQKSSQSSTIAGEKNEKETTSDTVLTKPSSNFFSNLTNKSQNESTLTNVTPISTVAANITPSFKFGSGASSTTSSSSMTSSSSNSAISTSLFGSKSIAQDENKQTTSSTTLPSSNFFSFLNNKQPSTTPEKSKDSTEPSNTMFKPFGSLAPVSSLFSTATTTTPSNNSTLNPAANAANITTPFFSFQSNKPNLFGGTSSSGGLSGSSSLEGGTNLFGAASSVFGTNTAAASTEGGGDAEEEPYEPPKPEASDIKEEGSVFTKRVKLFYFNDKEKKFCDRGIGNLFIKPINNGDATQLIVRADTALGNILLNVKLNKMLPIAKVGNKDVSYVCVPNPPIPQLSTTAPCRFLFKVKTEDDANELFDKLNEYKK